MKIGLDFVQLDYDESIYTNDRFALSTFALSKLTMKWTCCYRVFMILKKSVKAFFNETEKMLESLHEKENNYSGQKKTEKIV